jgi:hypothetical protein
MTRLDMLQSQSKSLAVIANTLEVSVEDWVVLLKEWIQNSEFEGN